MTAGSAGARPAFRRLGRRWRAGAGDHVMRSPMTRPAGAAAASVVLACLAGASGCGASHGAAASPGGSATAGVSRRCPAVPPVTVYVGTGAGTVVPVRAATNIAGRPIPVGIFPMSLAVTPDARDVYVAVGADGFAGGAVIPIDPPPNKAGPPIGETGRPTGIPITPDGKTGHRPGHRRG